MERPKIRTGSIKILDKGKIKKESLVYAHCRLFNLKSRQDKLTAFKSKRCFEEETEN